LQPVQPKRDQLQRPTMLMQSKEMTEDRWRVRSASEYASGMLGRLRRTRRRLQASKAKQKAGAIAPMFIED